MQLDAILEVAIGLIFAWLVLSVATMEVQNWIGQMMGVRAKFLEQTILDMFRGEKNLVDQFYNHPFIRELCKFDKNGKIIKKPDYIPNDVFSKVAFEVLMSAGVGRKEAPPGEAVSFGAMASSGVQEAKSAVNPELARTMDHLFPGMGQPTDTLGAMSFGLSEKVSNLSEKAKEYQKNVEDWFDKMMKQSSDWYKTNAKKWALGIGIVLALIFNIDSFHITEALWREPVIRQALVQTASSVQPGENTPTPAEIPSYFEALALPVGWTTISAKNADACNSFITSDKQFAIRSGNECRLLANVPKTNDFWGWVAKILGILVSGAAAMQGAPFWFDVLKKAIGLRPEQTTEPKG